MNRRNLFAAVAGAIAGIFIKPPEARPAIRLDYWIPDTRGRVILRPGFVENEYHRFSAGLSEAILRDKGFRVPGAIYDENDILIYGPPRNQTMLRGEG